MNNLTDEDKEFIKSCVGEITSTVGWSAFWICLFVMLGSGN